MIVSFFHSSPAHLRAIPGLRIALTAAGVRHVEMQGWANPARQPSFGAWLAYMGEEVVKGIGWCAAHHLDVVLRLDGAFRTHSECGARMRWNGDCVKEAARIAWAGPVHHVQVCDEMSNDISKYGDIDQLAELWYAEGGPPLLFPSFTPTVYSSKWYAKGISVQTRWWAHKRHEARVKDIETAVGQIPVGYTGLKVVTIPVGLIYQKRIADDYYHAGKDKDVYKPAPIETIGAMLKVCADAGIDHVRLYGLDLHPDWLRARRAAKVGSRAELQQGTGLFDSRWAEIMKLIGEMTRRQAA